MYSCLVCGDEGDKTICEVCIGSLHDQTTAARRHDIVRAITACGVTGDLTGAELTPAHKTLLGGIDPFGRLILFGPPGAGKTYLAAGLLRENLEIMASVVHPLRKEWWSQTKFITANDLLESLRPSESQEVSLEDYRNYSFLVIDDLGSEKASDWVGQQWHALLDTRMNSHFTTIITTNFNSKDLESIYGSWGKPIVDRLKKANLIKMLNESRRKAINNARS